MKAMIFSRQVISVLPSLQLQKGKIVDKFSRTCLLIIAISVAYIALDNLFWTLGDLFSDNQNEEIYEALDEIFERIHEIERVIN